MLEELIEEGETLVMIIKQPNHWRIYVKRLAFTAMVLGAVFLLLPSRFLENFPKLVQMLVVLPLSLPFLGVRLTKEEERIFGLFPCLGLSFVIKTLLDSLAIPLPLLARNQLLTYFLFSVMLFMFCNYKKC